MYWTFFLKPINVRRKASRELKLGTLQEVTPDAKELTFSRSALSLRIHGNSGQQQGAGTGGAEIDFAIQQWGDGKILGNFVEFC